MRPNPIRFTGMASGMDTDSIVKDLMRPQQLKVDRQKKSKALIMLRQDAWKEMNQKLYGFHTKFTHKMSLDSTFNKTETTISNPNAISIGDKTTVPQGTHRFEIKQLAESANVVGRIDIASPQERDAFKVEDVLTSFDGAKTPKEMKMVVNGKDIVFNVKHTDDLNEVAKNMNAALKKEGFAAQYDSENGSFFVSSTATGEAQSIELGVSVGAGPEGSRVESGESKLLFEKLGLSTTGKVQGKDATYKYNGVDGFTSASNKVKINGFEATFKAANVGEVITISSEMGTDATYTFVKEFITEYNNLVGDIKEKLGEKPAKGIDPLTSEERAAMSESDIKLWEEKVNKSLFYRDAQLESFVSSTRRIMGGIHEREYDLTTKGYAGDELKYKDLSALGIMTGPWQERGKLHIEGDEDDPLYASKPNKLKEAIKNNPEDVMKFFTTLGKKLYDDQKEALKSSELKSAMNFYNDKAMEKQVKSHDKQIITLEERMYKMEQAHYAKFAAMEKMLSSLNNQSSWLSQQSGGQ